MKPDSEPGILGVQLPALYSILVEEFSKAPEIPEPYQPGDKVTRENFANFMIYSFAISMGQPTVQIIFMEWLKRKTGLNYKEIIANFSKAGGWEALSEGEHREFLGRFGGVGKHADKYEEFEYEDEIKNELEKLEDMIEASTEDVKIYFERLGKDVKKMDLSEFKIIARQEVMRLRQKAKDNSSS